MGLPPMFSNPYDPNLQDGVISIPFPTPITSPSTINFMVAEFVVIIDIEIEWFREIIFNDVNSYFFEVNAFLNYPPPPPPTLFEIIGSLDITDPVEGKTFRAINDKTGTKRTMLTQFNYNLFDEQVYKNNFGFQIIVTPFGNPLGLELEDDILNFRIHQYIGVVP
jgi:hypothetical protein